MHYYYGVGYYVMHQATGDGDGELLRKPQKKLL
jgi:hypothetical protein